jgi:hypothetical protein
MRRVHRVAALLTNDLVLAVAIGASILALYAATLQPDFGGPEDTPKFQFIGYVLGVPHPPGYPLYVLLSHFFVTLPFGTVAFRANVFSAVMAAVACALAYAIARRLGAGRWTALCAAIGLATGASFWRSAVFAEVYSLAAVMAGLAIALLLVWGARGGARWLVAAFGAFALGLGNHLTIVGIVPAFAVYVLTRGRPVWSMRTVGACALLLAAGLAQYGLILVRTRQPAPYVEIRAETVAELFQVVTAERFADQRFAFGPAVLLAEHLPALVSLTAREFGVAGTIAFLIGAIAACRRADAALVLGAAGGMFLMALNISGDLKGFITPVMVLLWPFAALGVETIVRHTRSIRAPGPAIAASALAAAALIPAINVAANYAAADQSGRTDQGRFMRAMFGQLPRGAGLVAEDYSLDMAWTYYTVTGEARPHLDVARVGFDAASVRQARTEGRRVFALATAATFLAAEGLSFTRTAIQGPTLDEWLASLPRASIVVGATAYAPFPGTLSRIGHRAVRPPGRPRPFEVFAVVARDRGRAWSVADDYVMLNVDAPSLAAPLPAFAGRLMAYSDRHGARIELASRVIAKVESGVALAAFAPDGTFVRALEFPPGSADRVEYPAAVYELAGESPCATLTTGTWTDLDAVLAHGSWVTTMPVTGSIAIESESAAFIDRPPRAMAAVLQGDGRIETTVTQHYRRSFLTTTLTRTGESRPVFRLAFDGPQSGVRARLSEGGARSSLRVCAHLPLQPLFHADESTAVLRADFESEPYFGAGWGNARRTAAGAERQTRQDAALLLPLEPKRSYRVSLDLDGEGFMTVSATLNGAAVGSCEAQALKVCELLLPSETVRDGVNALLLSAPGGELLGSPRMLTFRAARISRVR